MGRRKAVLDLGNPESDGATPAPAGEVQPTGGENPPPAPPPPAAREDQTWESVQREMRRGFRRLHRLISDLTPAAAQAQPPAESPAAPELESPAPPEDGQEAPAQNPPEQTPGRKGRVRVLKFRG